MNNSAIHIPIDLETLSLKSNAAIVQIGAVTLTGQTFKECVDPGYYNHYREYDISKSTLNWWSTQDPALLEEVMGGTLELSAVLDMFHQWCYEICAGDMSRIYLWSKGADFDIPILRHAYDQNTGFPFHYRNMRCIRTLSAVHNIPIPVAERAHDALSDAMTNKEVVKCYLQKMQLNGQ